MHPKNGKHAEDLGVAKSNGHILARFLFGLLFSTSIGFLIEPLLQKDYVPS
jgi:hypothetical protein